MDKKIIIIIIIAAVLILVTGFLAYSYFNGFNDGAEKQMPAQNYQQEELPKENINGNNDGQKTGAQTDIETNKPKGSFTICVDNCGDRICQKPESIGDCSENSLNCSCPENYSECPQDCPKIP